MYFKSFDKTKIFYKISKARKPKETILFIHGGFFGNHTLLKKIYSGFKKDYDLLLPDMRAKGNSDFPKNIENICLEDYAKDMYEILKRERAKEVFIVSVSFGGLIALKFTEMFSKKIRIKKLVLISSSFTTKHAKKDFLISKLAIPGLKGLVKTLDLVWPFGEKRKKEPDYSLLPKRFFHLVYGLSLIRNNSFKTILLRYRAGFNILEHEIKEDTLRKVNCPVLIIYGERDNLFSMDIQEKMVGLLRKAELKIIRNSGHNIYIHNTEEVNRLISEFLA
jgi:pimeloyl-ACP methyl ester carboxylesterase